MKTKSINIVWAIALIAAGAFFLVQELGVVPDFPPFTWALFLAGVSLVFFATYFVNGVKEWWWLLPAMACGAVAITITLGEAGYDGSYVAAPIMAGLAIPFIVAYGIDTRNNWWALIPAWVMGVMTVVVLLSDIVAGEIVGTVVLFGIGLPFLFVYLTDRSRWWALIPAGVMGVVGLIPLMSLVMGEDLVGSFVMFLFAVPFVVVYFWSPRNNWWAIIPAGVMATIGLAVLVETLAFPSGGEAAVMTGILFLGWALTFGALWLRRTDHRTDWAKYPAAILVIAGGIALAFGPGVLRYITPLLIIGAGTVLLLLSFRRKPV